MENLSKSTKIMIFIFGIMLVITMVMGFISFSNGTSKSSNQDSNYQDNYNVQDNGQYSGDKPF